MMLLDSSVVVAGFIKAHPHNPHSLKLIQQAAATKNKYCLCVHSVAEIYSVLTAFPVQPRISPQLAKELIFFNLKENFVWITLNDADYLSAVDLVQSLQLRSGSIFDALIFEAALKKKVQGIVTWNKKDFERFVVTKKMDIYTPDQI